MASAPLTEDPATCRCRRSEPPMTDRPRQPSVGHEGVGRTGGADYSDLMRRPITKGETPVVG
jgi:hypothetical protein